MTIERCPDCGRPSDGREATCPGCGRDLSTWRKLRALRESVDHALAAQAEASRRLGILVEELVDLAAARGSDASIRSRTEGFGPDEAVAPSPSPGAPESAPPAGPYARGADPQFSPPLPPGARPHADASGAGAPPEHAMPSGRPSRGISGHPRPNAAGGAPDPSDATPRIQGIARPKARQAFLDLPRGSSELDFGRKWPLAVGILLMLFGVGFFLKYSLERNWIGPAARIAMAYGTGVLCLGLGEHFRRRGLAAFGLPLAGGGIAILYAATFAAFQLYHLLGQLPAFALMALITALAGTLAWRYDARGLAILGTLGGFITPLLVSTGSANHVALFTWVTLLDAGVLALASVRRWAVLNWLGFLGTWLLFAGWYFARYEHDAFWITTFFVNLFFLVFALAPFAYALRNRGGALSGEGIAFPNAFIAFGFSWDTIGDRFDTPAVGLVSVAYAAVHLLLARELRRRDPGNLASFTSLLARAAVFLVITVPVLVSGPWITAFWCAQAAAIVWLAGRRATPRFALGGLALLALALVKLLFDYSDEFGFVTHALAFRDGFEDGLAGRWLTVACALASTWAAARFAADIPTLLKRGVPQAIRAAFVLLLFVLLNWEVAGAFSDWASGARPAALSVLWALFALALMLLGFRRALPALRLAAIALFAATILKVFASDMSGAATPFRILSFFVLGVLLVATSFLYHRFAAWIAPDTNDSPAPGNPDQKRDGTGSSPAPSRGAAGQDAAPEESRGDTTDKPLRSPEDQA